MYFKQSEFHVSCDLISGFRFLSVEAGRSKRRPSRCYGFPHRNFQEFFAAFYHCCQLEDGEILPDSFVANNQYFEKFRQVLMFTTGMLARRREAKAKALIARIASQVNLKDSGDYLYVVLCCNNESEEEQIRAESARDLGSLLKIWQCKLCKR